MEICICSLSLPLGEKSSLELCHPVHHVDLHLRSIDGFKAVIRPGTPESEGLRVLLHLMSVA